MQPADDPQHRAGFVPLLGKPNVGKSTLLNTLIGQSLAPVSQKPQTTRQNQVGILNLPLGQLVLQDTPGLHRAQDKLGQFMNQEAEGAIRDADLVLVLFDGTQGPDEDDEQVKKVVQQLLDDVPALFALNKIDRCPRAELDQRAEQYRAWLDRQALLEISAQTGQGIDALLTQILEHLPLSPPLFEWEILTLSSERELAGDLIRAAALEILRQEVPYSIAVRVDEFKERGQSGAYIGATLFVERESQKGIVIGKGGQMLKQIGIAAREKIELMSGRSVHLDLRVKLLKGWKNNPESLRRLGYRVGP